MVDKVRVEVNASVESSITRTVGGRVLATIHLNGVDYVELHWIGGPDKIVEKNSRIT